jgi:hypothetical protein
MNTTYFEILPKLLFYGQTDWISLQERKNCGFYTYGDVFFKSYHPNVTAIYFVFKKTLNSICQLDTTIRTFKNQTWLYANSLGADPKVCGYFVGVANAAPTEHLIHLIRSTAVRLGVAVAAGVSVLLVAIM